MKEGNRPISKRRKIDRGKDSIVRPGQKKGEGRENTRVEKGGRSKTGGGEKGE